MQLLIGKMPSYIMAAKPLIHYAKKALVTVKQRFRRGSITDSIVLSMKCWMTLKVFSSDSW